MAEEATLKIVLADDPSSRPPEAAATAAPTAQPERVGVPAAPPTPPKTDLRPNADLDAFMSDVFPAAIVKAQTAVAKADIRPNADLDAFMSDVFPELAKPKPATDLFLPPAKNTEIPNTTFVAPSGTATGTGSTGVAPPPFNVGAGTVPVHVVAPVPIQVQIVQSIPLVMATTPAGKPVAPPGTPGTTPTPTPAPGSPNIFPPGMLATLTRASIVGAVGHLFESLAAAQTNQIKAESNIQRLTIKGDLQAAEIEQHRKLAQAGQDAFDAIGIGVVNLGLVYRPVKAAVGVLQELFGVRGIDPNSAQNIAREEARQNTQRALSERSESLRPFSPALSQANAEADFIRMRQRISEAAFAGPQYADFAKVKAEKEALENTKAALLNMKTIADEVKQARIDSENLTGEIKAMAEKQADEYREQARVRSAAARTDAERRQIDRELNDHLRDLRNLTNRNAKTPMDIALGGLKIPDLSAAQARETNLAYRRQRNPFAGQPAFNIE